MKKYKVETENRGTLYFDAIPEDIYVAGGFQNPRIKENYTILLLIRVHA
jgi:hypothetical protein